MNDDWLDELNKMRAKYKWRKTNTENHQFLYFLIDHMLRKLYFKLTFRTLEKYMMNFEFCMYRVFY